MASSEHPLWQTAYAKQQGRPLRRRPDIKSFPFTPTQHPFTKAHSDLLFSLLVTLDSITQPEEWHKAWQQKPPRTAWRQRDDMTQSLLQDAASGIIDFWRHLARSGRLPFKDNATSSIGLVSITTLARYLNGDLQNNMRVHKEWWEKMKTAGKDGTKSRLLLPMPKHYSSLSKATHLPGNKMLSLCRTPSSTRHLVSVLLQHFSYDMRALPVH